MNTQRARVLTKDERFEAVAAAREGMSLEGIAGLLGLSRRWFQELRRSDLEFDADLMRAIAAYEQELVGQLKSGELEERAFASKELARRFPLRHGADPRLRAINDEAIEDVPEGERKTTSSDRADEAIEALIAWKKEGKG